MKKAFTLIEVIVSLILFSLIILVMFGNIDNLRQLHRLYEIKEKELSEKNRLVSLLRSDFDRAVSITLETDTDNRYTVASINGSNHSLYGIFEPYVTWLVLKEQRRLIRMESPSPTALPLSEEALYQTHVDSIGSECERFRIYESAKHRLITVSFENESPVLIEVRK